MTDDRQLYLRAVADVLEFEKASVSWLQRRLRLGYNAAARLIEKMEAEKIIGPPDHVGRRELLVDRDGRRKDAPPAAQGPAASPWDRNSGKYDQPSSERPKPRVEPLPKGSAPLPPLYEAERKALRGVAALPAARAVAIVEHPPFEGWPAVFAVEDDGSVAVRELPFEPEPKARDPEAVSADRLRQIVERLEALIDQRSEIGEIIRDVLAFAKMVGFEPKGIRAVIKMRAMETTARKEFEAIVATYRHALGIEEPEFAIALPPATRELPPPPKKLSAREKKVREAILLTAASRAVEEV